MEWMVLYVTDIWSVRSQTTGIAAVECQLIVPAGGS